MALALALALALATIVYYAPRVINYARVKLQIMASLTRAIYDCKYGNSIGQ
jgi:hypothetical protein